MYIPAPFHQTSTSRIRPLVAQHPFATLISVTSDTPTPRQPIISQLPLLLDTRGGGHGVLRGHLARANPHWRELRDDRPATALFHGPDAYVSPAWYGSPGVPTWNYASVSMSGTCRLIEDPQRLWSLLLELTATHETNGPGWKPELPEHRRELLLAAIVGFELRVTEVEAKFKLSQNRPPGDHPGILAGLDAGDDNARAVADLMRELTGPGVR